MASAEYDPVQFVQGIEPKKNFGGFEEEFRSTWPSYPALKRAAAAAGWSSSALSNCKDRNALMDLVQLGPPGQAAEVANTPGVDQAQQKAEEKRHLEIAKKAQQDLKRVAEERALAQRAKKEQKDLQHFAAFQSAQAERNRTYEAQTPPECQEDLGTPDLLSANPNRGGRQHRTGYCESHQVVVDSGWPVILPPSPERVRFCHISDTHFKHRQLALPDANVLLHTGDLVQNKSVDVSKASLLTQLEDFCGWLGEQATRFDLVIFIAGNHDTLLDPQNKSKFNQKALDLVRALPGNCIYLTGDEPEPVDFRGLKIWGSPFSVKRNKSMRSNAFERDDNVRQEHWCTKMPSGLDVLMSHAPAWTRGMQTHDFSAAPRFGGHPDTRDIWSKAKNLVNDLILGEELKRLGRGAPRIVAAGHWHDNVGVYTNGKTMFSMASQEANFMGGGIPILFDLEARA